MTHPTLSQRALDLKPSQIREVAELGMGMEGVIPLWFGEGAWPTDPIAVAAAQAALADGDHRYLPNNGKPGLRAEICRYHHRVQDLTIDPSRITVTASGMQGLALSAQAITSPGDRIVALAPGWPNLAETFKIAGATIHLESLTVRDGRWALDLDRLITALTPDTRALLVNAPNNPTGWCLSADEITVLLTHCRRHGIWIVSDDVYARLYFADTVAPSFLSVAEPEDRVISVNSFSKAWSMTGWRLGWIVSPAELEAPLGMLTEFNIACQAGFIQAAGEAMLRDGEPVVALLRERIRTAKAVSQERLRNLPGVSYVDPEGAFYCFFAVEGMSDSVSFAKRLLHEAKVGLAPGRAFGEAGEGYLRLCYAQPEEVLHRAFDQLAVALDRRRG